MQTRQTRIYAPSKPPYDGKLWGETMIARIIKPLSHSGQGLEWIWFTRYASLETDFADSDGTHCPTAFFGGGLCRSLRLRFQISEDHRSEFEASAGELIQSEGCWIADWRDYDSGELCSDRFTGEDRTDSRRAERKLLVMKYLHAVSRLALHSLVPADQEGRWRFEMNDDPQNAYGSTFFSLHHLFCNATNVPLGVLVIEKEGQLLCGTRMYPPFDPMDEEQWRAAREYQIRF